MPSTGTTADVPEDGAFDPIDISSVAFWAQPAVVRDQSFAELRRTRPVSFHRPFEGSFLPGGQGFWALVRHRDVVFASRHPELFCSGNGVTLEGFPPDVERSIVSFLAMDAPRHTTIRRLISHAFTPRQVGHLEQTIRHQAAVIVAEALSAGEGDAVELLASGLPLWTISEMLGIPEADRPRVYRAANTGVAGNDPDLVPPGDEGLAVVVQAIVELASVACELAAWRRRKPGDDLMSAIVAAELDGDRLSDEELTGFFTLLAVAGNDTTRNSISHGIHAFADNPDQWSLLRTDPTRWIGPAVEEVVRWATPVMTFRRTATEELELAGRCVDAGDHVVLFYTSANRDETVFPDPWRFAIDRDANEHVGFGGGGPHFCLGAHLARTQLRAVFAELANSVAHFDIGEPSYLVSNFIHGVKHLPCRFVFDDQVPAT